jgi:hypothetical protein
VMASSENCMEDILSSVLFFKPWFLGVFENFEARYLARFHVDHLKFKMMSSNFFLYLLFFAFRICGTNQLPHSFETGREGTCRGCQNVVCVG